MKTSHLFLLIVVAAVVGIVLYSLPGNETSDEYIRELQHERKEKDTFMKSGDDSPFANAKEPFTGLHYFEPDLKYRVSANLLPLQTKNVLTLPTSDGKEKQYQEYAIAEFELDGLLNKLLILEILDDGPYRGTLFLAFADETSARETYGAGRYLDIKKTPGATSILLDFNKAYNPYCAYSDNYSCPFPPKENILKLAIRAGEKTYH